MGVNFKKKRERIHQTFIYFSKNNRNDFIAHFPRKIIFMYFEIP